MKIELTPDAAYWVETAVSSGRFSTASDAVQYAITLAKHPLQQLGQAILGCRLGQAQLRDPTFTGGANHILAHPPWSVGARKRLTQRLYVGILLRNIR